MDGHKQHPTLYMWHPQIMQQCTFPHHKVPPLHPHSICALTHNRPILRGKWHAIGHKITLEPRIPRCWVGIRKRKFRQAEFLLPSCFHKGAFNCLVLTDYRSLVDLTLFLSMLRHLLFIQVLCFSSRRI